jgi:CopG family nickel-responsive transcriptional regulator
MKIGVYIPGELARKLEDLMKDLSVYNFSHIVQEALRMYIIEREWKTRGLATGVIVVLYNHEVRGVDEALTDIQHEYLELISAVMHIHLDRENCLVAIAVKGDSNSLKKLIGSIESLKGVKLVRPILISTAP